MVKIAKIECLQLRAPQSNVADCDGAVDTAAIRVTADNGVYGLGETDAPPNAIAALLETPGSTLLGLNYVLDSPKYRSKIVCQIEDPIIKHFWQQTFDEHIKMQFDLLALACVEIDQEELGK